MTGMSVGCKLTDRLTDIFTDLRVVALRIGFYWLLRTEVYII